MSDNSKAGTLLTLVVPVFNEQAAIDPFLARVREVFENQHDVELELLFVNDGSSDKTLEILLKRQTEDDRIKIVDLSRNFGKEAALTAGLDEAQGNAVVPIDVDLQHPPETILQMVPLWREGFEVVLARRKDRRSDGIAQRLLANMFYKLHNSLSDPKIPADVGDFRLLDFTVVRALKRLPESRRFMKGLFAWAGFKTAMVEFDCPPREHGNSSFNKWGLWNFALEGITSFSTSLLRVWTYIGMLVATASFIYAAVITFGVLFHGTDVPGYASLAVMIMFLGGLQLIGTGILGEYLGRTYIESKRRPVYLIRKVHSRKQPDA